MTGIFLYLLLTAAIILLIVALRQLHAAVGRWLLKRPVRLGCYTNLLLLAASIMLVMLGLETTLVIMHAWSPQGTHARHFPPTIPDAWKRRPAEVEGAYRAWYWHDHLHVYDQNGMRRAAPFPPKKPDVCRVMVVGDSLTYGYGIAEDATYARLLESALAEDDRIEVLNLGIPNLQSEDILDVITFFTPQLEPDLILYGVCLNDFLNAGEVEGTHEQMRRGAVPLPAAWKAFLIEHTLSGAFLEQRYNELLMTLGIRADFFANILNNFQDYQQRFARDVAAMNRFVTERGLPPVVGMVLNQLPATSGRSYEITRIAEQAMTAAGMTVIPSATYYEANDGRVLTVSPWEGHPNEEANRIFAEAFLTELRQHPALQRCRREITPEEYTKRTLKFPKCF